MPSPRRGCSLPPGWYESSSWRPPRPVGAVNDERGQGSDLNLAPRQSRKVSPRAQLSARYARTVASSARRSSAPGVITEPGFRRSPAPVQQCRVGHCRLRASFKALLRRPGGVLGMTLEAGNVRLDTVGRELVIGGIPVRLSRRELTIFEQMMRRFGRIVPKAVLEEKLYGIDEEPDSNPIPVHVHHLRRQLDAAGASLMIHTIRGVGYILAEAKA